MWLRVHLRLKQRGMLSHLPDILRPPVARPGKDKLVKYWDADKFEHLLTLEGHHAEVGAQASRAAAGPAPAGMLPVQLECTCKRSCPSPAFHISSRPGQCISNFKPHSPASPPNHTPSPSPFGRCGAWLWAAWATWWSAVRTTAACGAGSAPRSPSLWRRRRRSGWRACLRRTWRWVGAGMQAGGLKGVGCVVWRHVGWGSDLSQHGVRCAAAPMGGAA